MYRPTHFEPRDAAQCLALMRAHPLATLVLPTADGLLANPIPMHLRADGTGWLLAGHVARANPVWRTAASGTAVALFMGPEAYVSPGWYPSKAEHGKVVPTWNYATVHAHGTLRFVDDTDWLRTLVGELTDHHEATRAAPWQVSDAPDEYIAQMIRAIVGFELRITRLEGKFKLSQNRSTADRQGVVEGLARAPDAAAQRVSDAMRDT